MMEVLPLTLPGMAGLGYNCTGQEEQGGEMSEMHSDGVVA